MTSLTQIIADLQHYQLCAEERPVQIIERDYAALTPREMELIELACLGLTTKAMAAEMKTVNRRIDGIRAEILRKLKCGNITEAVALLFKAGVLK